MAKAYYANTHPSIGNYFMLTTGQIITNDDGYTGTVTVDNVVRELLAAGKTWKEYSEALPHQGYYGGDTGEYAERHNPLSYMSDVRNDPTQQQNLVPFTQLATDIANHTLPNYGFIVPDLLDDAHDGTLAQADAWLQTNIAPLLASPDFNTPGGGLLIITFDESEDSDTEFGGGHVVWVAVGPERQPRISAERFAHSGKGVPTPEHSAASCSNWLASPFSRSLSNRAGYDGVFRGRPWSVLAPMQLILLDRLVQPRLRLRIAYVNAVHDSYHYSQPNEPSKSLTRHRRPRTLFRVRHDYERPCGMDATFPRKRTRAAMAAESSCPRRFRGYGPVGRAPDGCGLPGLRLGGLRPAELQTLGLSDGARHSQR